MNCNNFNSKTQTPQLYTHVSECEAQLDALFERNIEVQSWAQSPQIDNLVYTMFMDKLREAFPAAKNLDSFIKLIEDICLCLAQIINNPTKTNIALSVTGYFKLRLGEKPMLPHIGEIINNITSILQEGIQAEEQDFLQSSLFNLRELFANFEGLKESVIYKKIYKVMMYIMATTIFQDSKRKFGFSLFDKLHRSAVKQGYDDKISFVYVVLDTLTFLCERGYQCFILGSFDPLFHSGKTYDEWMVKATLIIHQSKFMSNPEPHGICPFTWLADLNDLIEKGSAMMKAAKMKGEFEYKMIRTLLSDLELKKSEHITKRAAAAPRRSPFSLLLFGGSSVGKSLFTDLLFFHLGKTLDLPTDAEYKYVRNGAEKHWTLFNSTQWFIVLDDIAFMNPSLGVPDPSMMEMLLIVNSITMVPEQADLADKGRTPMRGEVVVASTNTRHLNAQYYFSNPYAVQRRFPFVLNIHVKAEYTKNEVMLDPSKVPIINEGEYPDFWNIEITKPVPINDDINCQRGKQEHVATFTNIYELMQFVSIECLKHKNKELQVIKTIHSFNEIILCTKCYKPQRLCSCNMINNIQGSEINEFCTPWVKETLRLQYEHDQPKEVFSYWKYFETKFLDFLINTYSGTYYGSSIISYICNMFFLYLLILRRKWISQNRTLMSAIGEKIDKQVFKPVGLVDIIRNNIVIIAGVCTMLFTFYKSYTWAFPTVNKEKQGGISSKIGQSLKVTKDERENPWYNNNYVINRMDVSDQSSSYKAIQDPQLKEILMNNINYIRIQFSRGESLKQIEGNMLCVAGHIYMCNAHFFPEGINEFDVTLINDTNLEGTTSNIRLTIFRSELIFMKERDIVFVKLMGLPPRKDITGLFQTNKISGSMNGFYLRRTKTGELAVNNLKQIKRNANWFVSNFGYSVSDWISRPETPTIVGDCGSLCIARSYYGPIILGLHYALDSNGNTLTMPITVDEVKEHVSKFNLCIVQSGYPMLNSINTNHVLGPVHPKSTFRFIEKGFLKHYGSLQTFRVGSASLVTKHLLSESALANGYPLKHTKPELKSWEPWRLAALDMVRPVTKLDSNLIQECADAFFKDILKTVPLSEIKEMCVLDDNTAINGAPGVMFINKMERNTSAGFPWGRGKSHYLEELTPFDDYTNPVTVTKEIFDRVDKIITNYQKGLRNMTIYSGCTKDEPVTFAKAEAKKTRIFTAMPMDALLVVRKYLLTFNRLMQKNNVAFECGIGVNTFSQDWDKFHRFLTKHGDQHMIAGDYSKFDKRMPPVVILAAFDIIKKLCKLAGYSEEDLKVISGIAEDTAFPLLNFRGDIVEMFGTNPSGHPLTVNINSLVNSIYVRYCYAKLSPHGDVSKFQEDVALLTYGDDNAMGVSPRAPWFNHTAMQKTLADVDIQYTMADKDAETVPYIPISQVSFLKRTWVWDEDLGAFQSPIEYDTICKQLHVCVRSKSVTLEEQTLDMVKSVGEEYFRYGKEIFEEKQIMLKQMVRENNLDCYVTPVTFPTYEQLYDRYWAA